MKRTRKKSGGSKLRSHDDLKQQLSTQGLSFVDTTEDGSKLPNIPKKWNEKWNEEWNEEAEEAAKIAEEAEIAEIAEIAAASAKAEESNWQSTTRRTRSPELQLPYEDRLQNWVQTFILCFTTYLRTRKNWNQSNIDKLELGKFEIIKMNDFNSRVKPAIKINFNQTIFKENNIEPRNVPHITIFFEQDAAKNASGSHITLYIHRDGKDWPWHIYRDGNYHGTNHPKNNTFTLNRQGLKWASNMGDALDECLSGKLPPKPPKQGGLKTRKRKRQTKTKRKHKSKMRKSKRVKRKTRKHR